MLLFIAFVIALMVLDICNDARINARAANEEEDHG